ncbi:MAG: hypothetical protein K2P93_08385 [Alphaproteobacteria bacterium]|nr:hypothetical protein [Alphaproteobacteria bacterium]
MKFNTRKNTSQNLLKLFAILLSTSFFLSEVQAMWGDGDSFEFQCGSGGPLPPGCSDEEEDSSEDHQTYHRMSPEKPVLIPINTGPCLIPVDPRESELLPSQPSGKKLVHIAPIYGNPSYGGAIVVQNRIIEKYSQIPLIQYDTKGDGHCLTYSIRIPRNELVDRISEALKQDTPTAQEIEDSIFGMNEFSRYFNRDLQKRPQILNWLKLYKDSQKWFDGEFAVISAILEGANLYVWENVDGQNRLIKFHEARGSLGNVPTKHLAYVQGCHYEIMASPMDSDFESQVAFGELHSSRQHLPPLHKKLYPTPEEIATQVLKNRQEGKIDRIRKYLDNPVSLELVSSTSPLLIPIDPKTGKPLPSAAMASPSRETADVIIPPSMKSAGSASPTSRPDAMTMPSDSIKFNYSFKGPFQPNGSPQGYTLTLDPEQKRGTKDPLRVISREAGHITVKGDGYVFFSQIPNGEMTQLNGQTLSFEAYVLSHTPGAYIQYWGYKNASSKKIKSTPHTGSGRWEKLSLNFTVDGSASQFFLYPAIMPGVELGSEVPEVEVRGVNLRKIKNEEGLPLTFNSSFRGASSSGVVPQGYTFVVDPVQKRGTKAPLSVILRGEGHVVLNGDGYVFFYQIPKGEMAQLDGQTLRFEAEVFSDTPGAYIQYWGYHGSSSEKIKSSSHTGSKGWEKLHLAFTVDGSASQFFLYPAVMPGVKEGSPTPTVAVKNVRLERVLQ